MANEVKNVNTLTHSNMKNVDTLTDANIKELNLLEFAGIGTGVWSASSAALGTARSRFFSACGTARTAMFVLGGVGTSYSGGSSGRLGSMEDYNGSTDGISSGTAISGIIGGMCTGGSTTSALTVGGTSTSNFNGQRNAYNWDDSSWSSVTNPSYIVGSSMYVAANTENNFLGIGGTVTGSCDMDDDRVESWNGSAWTKETVYTGSSLGPNGGSAGGTGESSAIITGGYYTPGSGSCDRSAVNLTYSYDGSSWSALATSTTSHFASWASGRADDFAYNHFDTGAAGATYLYDGAGDAWSSGGSNSNDRYAANQSTGTTTIDAAQFGGGDDSGYADAQTTIALFDR